MSEVSLTPNRHMQLRALYRFNGSFFFQKKKKTTHRHVLRLILIWTRRVRRGARGQQEGEGGEESELHDSGRRSF